MFECYDPAVPGTTGREFIDADYDGYAETIVADTDGDEVLSGDSVPFPGGSGDTIYEVPAVRS